MSALKEKKPENKEALNNIPDNINDAFQTLSKYTYELSF